MVADALLSRSITNLDGNNSASPISLPLQYDTAGFNIGARIVQTSDYCTATTGGLATTSSTYKLVRLRSNVKIKSVKFFTDAVLDSYGTPTLTWNVGAYYSDSTVDGTQASLQGTLISSSCFFSALATPQTVGVGGAQTSTLIISTTMDKMLWDFLGLTAPGAEDAIYGDPGGFIDVVASPAAAAHTAVSGNLAVIVDFAE